MSKRTITAALTAGALALVIAPAHSQTRTATGTTNYAAVPETGFYAGIGLGRSQARNSCGGLGGIGFVGSCDDKDTTWNLTGGYQINRNIAVELGYVDLGKWTAAGTVGGAGVNASADGKGWELLGVGMLPVYQNISVYAKAGLFRWDVDAIGRAGGTLAASSDHGTDFTYGLGGQYGFNRNMAAVLEWQRYNEVGGSSIGNANVNVMRVGLRYKFF
jgi:OmpA-OmpF porin, OOP family